MPETKPLAQMTHEAIQLLYQKLGIVDTLRFLNQFTIGFGDYPAERDALFDDVSLDDMWARNNLERKKEGNQLLIAPHNQM